jgi:hypothetical protein
VAAFQHLHEGQGAMPQRDACRLMAADGTIAL